MRIFKRISVMLLVVVMTAMSFSATIAFAAEASNPDESVYTEKNAVARTSVIHTQDDVYISTTSSKAGNPFVSPSGTFTFDVDFESASGRVVAIRLHDRTTNSVVQEWQNSLGAIVQVVHLSAGHEYIFEYLLASGSGTVRVKNNVTETY